MRGLCLRQIKALVISLSFVLVMWGSANSQGLYFKEGQSCAGGGLAISADKDITGMGAFIGGCYAGRLDLGIMGSLSRHRETSKSTTAIGISAGGYPLKQRQDFPISIYAGLSYEAASLKLDYDTEKFHSTTFAASLAHSIQLNNGSRLIPEVGLAHSEIKNDQGYYFENTGVTDYIFSLHLVSPDYNDRIVAFSPGVAFNEDNVAVNVSFEVYFSHRKYESE